MDSKLLLPPFSRRTLALGTAGLSLAGFPFLRTAAAQESAEELDSLTIDLRAEPESIDPALAYSGLDWSIVHSIYDAPIGIASDGSIVPLAAQTFEAVDEFTWQFTLKPNLTFHDGSPVNYQALQRSLEYIRASDSLAKDQFATIDSINSFDALTVQITTTEPSPWLPAQIAVWLVLLPEGFDADIAQDAPIGSGPYKFVSYERGAEIKLERFEEYPADSPKGTALANEVIYHFVPEAGTRVADLGSGSAQIVAEVPNDQFEAVRSAGAEVVESEIVGSAWIRIATDIAPFDNPLVRQALNLAIDVESIAQSLVSEKAMHLASIFPDERALGFDPDLAPFAYDPDQARTLLEEAGLADGFDCELEVTTGTRSDIAEAIAAQLNEVGCRCTVKVSDYPTFNAGWKDAEAPALRMVTWSPLFEPHTLLSLVFASEGFLSRYNNAEVDELIATGAAESNPEERVATYQNLAQVMYDDPACIYLWNLTATYGVSADVQGWTPRGDEYLLATAGAQ